MKPIFIFISITILFLSCDESPVDPSQEYKLIVKTTPVTEIAGRSAIGGGNVESQGERLLSMGVCWNTLGTPTILNNITKHGAKVGDFTSDLAGLTPNTTYYIRAYATNNKETVYGDELTFTTAYKVYDGDKTFITQQEVDDFGNQGYTVVTGNVTIGISETPSKEIDNLLGLIMLDSIGGALEIYDNDALLNLNGLKNLLGIGGSLTIKDNWSLKDIKALGNITSIPGDLTMSTNSYLLNFDGLQNIITIAGALVIEFNSIKNIDEFKNLKYVGANIIVEGNSRLENIDGLRFLQIAQSRLQISRNDILTNIEGLANLTTVEGELVINQNPHLANLEGLRKLNTVLWLQVDMNDKLSNLDGLNNLTTIKGNFSLFGNHYLKNLDALINLGYLGGELRIGGNNNLLNINGLSNANPLHVTVIINPVLSDLCGIQSNNGYIFYRVYDNAYNPSEQDMIEGNCSQ